MIPIGELVLSLPRAAAFLQAKRCFPKREIITHFVDLLDIIGRKLFLGEIGNKSFIIVFRYLDPYDSESQEISIF